MKGPTHHIRLNKEARADLACWRQFLYNFNGVKLIKKPTWKNSNTFKLFSDASFKACAAIFGHHWLQVKFPESWKEVHIAAKELLPVMLAFKLWSDQLKGVNILFVVDNISIFFEKALSPFFQKYWEEEQMDLFWSAVGCHGFFLLIGSFWFLHKWEKDRSVILGSAYSFQL